MEAIATLFGRVIDFVLFMFISVNAEPTEQYNHEMDLVPLQVKIEPMPPEKEHLTKIAYEIEHSIIKPHARLQEIKKWEIEK